jgi:hypothetical protein
MLDRKDRAKQSTRVVISVCVLILLGYAALSYRAWRAMMKHEDGRSWARAVRLPGGWRTIEEFDADLASLQRICPLDGTKLTFVPTNGIGQRVIHRRADGVFDLDTQMFYAYCGHLDRRGRMLFQFGGVLTFALREDQVSWLFCRRVETLNYGDFVRENEFRQRQGKPTVPQLVWECERDNPRWRQEGWWWSRP